MGKTHTSLYHLEIMYIEMVFQELAITYIMPRYGFGRVSLCWTHIQQVHLPSESSPRSFCSLWMIRHWTTSFLKVLSLLTESIEWSLIFFLFFFCSDTIIQSKHPHKVVNVSRRWTKEFGISTTSPGCFLVGNSELCVPLFDDWLADYQPIMGRIEWLK